MNAPPSAKAGRDPGSASRTASPEDSTSSSPSKRSASRRSAAVSAGSWAEPARLLAISETASGFVEFLDVTTFDGTSLSPPTSAALPNEHALGVDPVSQSFWAVFYNPPPGLVSPPLTLSTDKKGGTLSLDSKMVPAPGVYTVVLRGQTAPLGKAPPPKGPPGPNFVEVAPPVTITIAPKQLAKFVVEKMPKLAPGKPGEVTVKIDRQFDFMRHSPLLVNLFDALAGDTWEPELVREIVTPPTRGVVSMLHEGQCVISPGLPGSGMNHCPQILHVRFFLMLSSSILLSSLRDDQTNGAYRILYNDKLHPPG